MSLPDAARPSKLFLYAPREVLERALSLGEFRLRPAGEQLRSNAAAQILPFGSRADQPSPASYLTLRFSSTADVRHYDDFPEADGCLIINDPESFGERLHRAAQRALPNWAGIDAAVAYGVPSPLGAAFSKEKQFSRQKEWLFAWRPMAARMSVNPVVIQLGSLAAIAELKTRSQ